MLSAPATVAGATDLRGSFPALRSSPPLNPNPNPNPNLNLNRPSPLRHAANTSQVEEIGRFLHEVDATGLLCFAHCHQLGAANRDLQV